MNICVAGGTGYVGLVTSVGLAHIGHRVTAIDIDAERVELLNAGKCPISETGVDGLLHDNLKAGRLRFTVDMARAAAESDIVIIAVGTPSMNDGQADVSQVTNVVEHLPPHLDSYKVIVLKSTVPVGTEELVRSILSRTRREGHDFDVVANPEFLREGAALRDFFFPDRIVVGARSERARKVLRSMYAPILDGTVAWPPDSELGAATNPVALVETDPVSAQIIKYASNAFLASRISFINEIAAVSERIGADVTQVARGMGYDPRIGRAYLEPGPGFGGPCLEKDLLALARIAEGSEYEPHFLKAILARNDRQHEELIQKIERLAGPPLREKTVAIFGLSFKAGTNDVRNSAAFRVIDHLQRDEGAVVRAHDPVAIEEARKLRPDVAYYEDPYETVDHADVLVILTEWPVFRELDYGEVKRRMRNPCIVDARNLLDEQAMRRLGLAYAGLGVSA